MASGPSVSETPSARTTNSSPPRRPDGVAGAQQADEPAGHGLEEAVPGLVAQRVVGVLEVVEVDEEGGHRVAGPPRPDQHLVGPVQDELAVGQSGQRVVQGTVGQELLELLPLGDVADVGRRSRPPTGRSSWLEMTASTSRRCRPGGASGTRARPCPTRPGTRRPRRSRSVVLVVAGGRSRWPRVPTRASGAVAEELARRRGTGTGRRPRSSMIMVTSEEFWISERKRSSLRRTAASASSFCSMVAPAIRITKKRTKAPMMVRATDWPDGELGRAASPSRCPTRPTAMPTRLHTVTGQPAREPHLAMTSRAMKA